jgi:hypothetical protein
VLNERGVRTPRPLHLGSGPERFAAMGHNRPHAAQQSPMRRERPVPQSILLRADAVIE